MCKSFKYLDGLICGDADEIFLDTDIVLANGEEFDYSDGIELDTDGLIIDGNGHFIDALGKARIFSCTGDVTIRNVTLKNGFHDENGGAVAVAEDCKVNIIESVISSSKSGEDGGAIFNEEGELTIVKSLIKDNAAEDFAGAINNWGVLNISESTFEKNRAKNGGAIFNDDGKLDISESRFFGNSAENGGVVFNNDGGEVSILRCELKGNAASKGGALFNENCEMKIAESKFFENTAEDGAAIHSSGELSIIESEFDGNKSNNDGGAIYTYRVDLRIEKSELRENTARNGGAIYGNDSEMSIAESVFSGNVAESSGGAICLEKSVYDFDNVDFRNNKPDEMADG